MCYYGLLFHRAYETQDQNSMRNGTESHATTQLHPCEGEAEFVDFKYVSLLYIRGSLVPRPSHHPVFVHRGGRPGIFYHVNDVSVYLGRQKGGRVPHQKNKLEDLSCSFYPKCLNICEAKNVPLQVWNEERMRRMRSFSRGSLPPSVYLGRHRCHSRDKIYQAFPLCFAYCKQSKKMDGGKAWEWGYIVTTDAVNWTKHPKIMIFMAIVLQITLIQNVLFH